MEQKKKQIAEAHVSEQIQNKKPRHIYTAEAQYIVECEIRDLLKQILDNQLEQMGKDKIVRDDKLPKAEYSGGKRRWRWFS